MPYRQELCTLLVTKLSKHSIISLILGNKPHFFLDGCRDVKINKNVFDSKYTTRDILIEHMRETDVQTDKKDKFIIKPIENLNTHMQWN